MTKREEQMNTPRWDSVSREGWAAGCCEGSSSGSGSITGSSAAGSITGPSAVSTGSSAYGSTGWSSSWFY